jgi:glycosyltransferase involved in cell wall biosynthesis
MKDPLISIVVPIYNVEKYLPKCIESILNQTYTNFELILVNDGSPDNSRQICEEYARRDDRIRVINKENGGLSSARNTGIHKAAGEYLGFIDSDDYIDESMYQELYNNAIRYSADVVICDFIKVQEDQVPKMDNSEYIAESFSNIQALKQLYDPVIENRVKWVIACNKLYKKCLFYDLKFEEGRIYEDEFIAHKILYKSNKITFIPNKLYYYVQRPTSIVGSPFSVKKFDRVYALKERVDFLRKIDQKDLSNLASNQFMELFFWNYRMALLDLNISKRELKMLKRAFEKSLIQLIENPLIGWKQKVFFLLFVIYPLIIKVK